MKTLLFFFPVMIAVVMFSSCKKEKKQDDIIKEAGYEYYQIGFKSTSSNWRDSAFVVRTNDPQLIQQSEAQLALPVSSRKIVSGKLLAGSGGYNKNASHEFGWHFKEDEWELVDVTVEIYDGKPYTDVDQHLSYWLNTVQRFGAWSSYIKKKL